MRKSASNGAVFGAILVAAVTSSIEGCASIWGFQDAIDEREDAAVDATTEAAIDGSAPVPPGADATVHSMQDASIARDGGDAALLAVADAAGETMDEASTDGPQDAGALETSVDTPAPECDASCVPAAPAGWQGPLLIFEALSPDAAPPGCAGDSWVSALDLVAGPSAAPASCTCTCGPPSGVACSNPSVSYFRDRACTLPCAAPTPVDSTCTSLSATGCGITPHFTIGPSATDGGACTPLATTSLPPLAWSSTAYLCAPAPTLELGTCDPGQACVPSTDSTSGPAILCVAQQGDVPCPSGYGFRHMPRGELAADAGSRADGGTPYFALANDDRGCSACNCEAPSAVTCTSSGIVAYSDSTCTMQAMTVQADAGCVAFDEYAATCGGAAASGGRCEPTGGVPVGGVTLTSPYTICCNR